MANPIFSTRATGDRNGDTKAQRTSIADVVSLYHAVAKCIVSDANRVDDIEFDDVEFGRAIALKHLRRLLPRGVDLDEIQVNGFFAGITIEVDDVVLDLNGHEMARNPAFHYQQCFFACVELKSEVQM